MKSINRLAAMILAAIVATLAFCADAQDRVTAVLQHGDTPTAFYGTNAFVDAMAAAEAGDIIYLSEGIFTAPTIDKAVNVIGKGSGTHINGTLNLALPEDATGLNMEGLTFDSGARLARSKTLKDAQFKRCKFSNSYDCDYYSDHINVSFTQCVFERAFTYSSSDGSCKGVRADNCIFKSLVSNYNATDEITFNHCIVSQINSNAGNFSNCIVLTKVTNYDTFSFINTIVPSDGGTIHADAIQENVTALTKAEIAALFKNTTDYQLTDEAAAQYIGSNGSQIGAHGGATPFTLVPAIPRITKALIGSNVNPDGTLPVEITAETNN